MNPSDYFPILIQVVLALLIAIIILVASHLFGQRERKNAVKDMAYECGLPSPRSEHPRFAIKFYLTAMLFIIFDIEVVFLIPWVVIYREFLSEHLTILTPMLVFLGLMIFGLYYEIRKGALEWDR
jgi:NADH-quinone oxidoreductase subunit A